MFDLINRLRQIDFRELTPMQIAVLVAGVIIGVWLIGQVLALLASLLPIAIAIIVLYFGFQWLTSESDEIPTEAKQTRQQRTVNEAIQNVLNFRNNNNAEEKEKEKPQAAAQATPQASPAVTVSNLFGQTPQEEVAEVPEEEVQAEEPKFNLSVEQIVNPETGFKEPNISRLIEQEEEKLKQMDQEADEIMSQLEARRQRLLNQRQEGGE